MQLKSFFAQDVEGNVISQPEVTVYEKGTTTLVTNVKDKNYVAKTNPFNGTATGLVELRLPDGEFDIKVEKGLTSFTKRETFYDDLNKEFSSVEKMLEAANAGKIPVGSTVKTLSYIEEQNKGSNEYTLKDAGDAGNRPDEDLGSVLHVSGGSGGLYFEGLFLHTVNPYQFGCLGDYNFVTHVGTDDTIPLQNLFNMGKRFDLQGGSYLFSTLTAHGNFYGEGSLVGTVSGSKPTFTELMNASSNTDRTTLVNNYWRSSIDFGGTFTGECLLVNALINSSTNITGTLTTANCATLAAQVVTNGQGRFESPDIVSVNSSGVGILSQYGGFSSVDSAVVVAPASRALYIQHSGCIIAADAKIGKTGSDAAAILFGGSMNLTSAVIEDADGNGLVINYGGSIAARYINIDSVQASAIVSESNGAIFAKDATITNVLGNEALATAFNGIINAADSNISAVAGHAAYAIGSGFINMPNAVVSGSINGGGNVVRAIGTATIIWEDPTTTGVTMERYSPRWNNHGNGNAIITTNDATASSSFEAISLFGDGSELEVTSGSISLSAQSMVHVDTENNATTDDLVNIHSGRIGQILILRCISSSRTVNLIDGTGNLRLAGGDFPLDHENDTITLYYNGTNWLEISRASNN